MRWILAAAFIALAIGAAPASYLCNELDARGLYELGNACRLDQADEARGAAIRRERQETDDFLGRQHRDSQRSLDSFLLDQRLRRLEQAK